MKTQIIVRPSLESILTIHSELIKNIGGLDGIRDKNLLDMSVNSPFQTFEGADLYPTLTDKAAHLMFSLIQNHAFLDGNKRIGVTAMIVFLMSNNVEINCTNEELASIGLGVADGTYDENYIKNWITRHTV